MSLGMLFHKLAPPHPPKPNFIRQIPSTISGKAGTITLHFYVPKDYDTQRRLYVDRPQRPSMTLDQNVEDAIDENDEEREFDKGKSRRVSGTFSVFSEHIRRKSMQARRWGGYPVVINFHGGGFTLGSATDDARWCGTVVDECHAVVVSVDYRLAPECPFPTAVEDGVDAVLWIHEHATELGIDPDKIALSGFSSGGNMAFTVPLRLYDEQSGFLREDKASRPPSSQAAGHALDGTIGTSASSSTTKVGEIHSSDKLRPSNEDSELGENHPNQASTSVNPNSSVPSQSKEAQTTITERGISNVKIRCIVPWYPSLDYTRSREQRRATCVRRDQELPAIFTDLFDDSYLHPPASISLDSPYLSPGVAPTSLLQHALPDEIIMHTCEWDMLLEEGEAFRKRLIAPPLNKNVWYRLVEGVPHGWDKAPNPWKPTPGVREHYLRACKEMRRVFANQDGIKLREYETGQPGVVSAAPRGSIQVVR